MRLTDTQLNAGKEYLKATVMYVARPDFKALMRLKDAYDIVLKESGYNRTVVNRIVKEAKRSNVTLKEGVQIDG